MAHRFEWGPGSLEASYLVADDQMTEKQIAERVGVSHRTVQNWKKHPEFVAKVQEQLRKLEVEIFSAGVAVKKNRLRRLNNHWQKAQQVVEERKQAAEADPTMAEVPGARTGMMIRTLKAIGQNQTVAEWRWDRELEKTILDIEKQAAIEMGQWTEKKDVTSGGQPYKCFLGVDPEKL